MKKIVLLCLFLYVANITVFAQYKVKPTEPASRTKTPLDNTELALQSNASVLAKKDSTVSKSTKVAKQTAKSIEKSVNSDEDEGISEEELAEIDELIAKAKSSLNTPRNDQSSQKAFEGMSPVKVVSPSVVQVVTPVVTVAKAKPEPAQKVPEQVNTEENIASNGASLAPREVALTEEEKKSLGGNNALKFKIPTEDAIDYDSVYVAPELPASFQGGAEALKQFFGQNLQFPQKYVDTELKGKVYVRFIVRRNGRIDKIHLVKGPNDECNQEALRVIKAMPKWTPATNNGNVVSSYHVLPVSFLIKKN
jgi:TonB family protein